tara:strand:+ start:401 stop:625 length:225 start_codon:yes stop_codon:yes gene_type:complete
MSKPTIRQVDLGDGNGLIWEIAYQGMVRRHSQPWQAEWLYNYLTSLYNCDETNPQHLSHGPSEHELDDPPSAPD